MLVKEFPNKVGYYAKDGVNYEAIIKKQDDPEIDLAGMGLDSNVDLRDYFRKTSNGFVQGNFSEHFLTLPHDQFLPKLIYLLTKCLILLQKKAGWVCGLGHGVLKTTPQENVKEFVQRIRASF